MAESYDFKYVLVPGKPVWSDCPTGLYEKLLNHWLAFWTEEYKAYGSTEVDPNNFFRQDKYTAILDGETVVATHALTAFNLDFPMDRYSYFHEMHSPEILSKIRENRNSRFYTLQYFMVNPDYSPRKTGLNLGAVMVALSLKHNEHVDGFLSAARSGVAAASLALKLGFERISDDHIVHRVPVSPIFCRNPIPYRRDQENQLVERLWKLKFDYTKESQNGKSQRYSRSGSGPALSTDEEVSL